MTNSLRSPVAATGSGSTAATPTVWLEIKRGRTLFPRRPVLAERFLIGAGSNCHLQLGGEGMPFLHSLLATSPGGASVEAFVPFPELRVNGQPLRTAQLCDGDEIAIGPFQFTVHLQTSLETDAIDPLYAPIPLDLAESEPEPEDLAGLSAAELVERIEAIETEVDELATAEQWGAASLLDAVRRIDSQSAADPLPSGEETEEIWVHELTALSQDIEHRLALLREREHEQSQRAEALLAAQAQLAEQLELAARSLATTEESRIRASA